MTVAHVFVPENRLAEILGDSRHPTVDSLEAAAKARVATLKDKIQEYVAGQLALIAALAKEREEIIFAECLSLGAAAQAICEVAGAAEMESLGEAALGIHAMVEALVTQGVWHSEALKLHIDALALLAAHPDLPRPEVITTLERLKAMRERVGVTTAINETPGG